MPGLKLEKIEYVGTNLDIIASCKSSRSKCPVCGKYSSSIHGCYTRVVADLPVFQNKTVIRLHTRKFKCKNKKCSKSVFSEQSPYIIRYSRRTIRACKLLDLVSIELTGNLGSLISKQLLLAVSSSTLLRMAHNRELPKIRQPKILGVDDWAYRKGVSYGTILIDMETSKPIDILESRDGKDLKKWLSKYPDVEIVTRDRASSYSAAIKEVCPKAVQVADRFHLYMNLSDALDKYFKSIRTQIRTLIKEKTSEIENAHEEQPPHTEVKITPQKPLVAMEFNPSKFDSRQEKFNKVKELQLAGKSIRRISKALGMCRATVRSYFSQDSLVPKGVAKSTNIAAFTDYILTQLSIEGVKTKDIIDQLRQLGFNGGPTQAYHNINAIKQKFKIQTPGFAQFQRAKISYIKPLTPRKLAKYIDLNLAAIKDPNERIYVKTLLDNIPELQVVRKLVQIFKNMMKSGRGNVRRWIDFVKRSKYKLYGLKSFANGLSRDICAVENGIHLPWSNGAVEGHVNRIKNIKRQMYGRANFDLLRKKVILSQSG
jgi:transposase